MLMTDKDQLLIGLIGDTHLHSQEGNALKNIIDDFKEKNIDYLFHVGDFTRYKVYNEFSDYVFFLPLQCFPKYFDNI